MQAVASPERPRSRTGETSSAPSSPGHLLSRFLFSSGDKEKSPACSSPTKSARKHPILSCLNKKSHKRQRQAEPLSPNINSTVSFHLWTGWWCCLLHLIGTVYYTVSHKVRDVMLVWRKGNIEKTVSVLQYCVLL